MSLEQTIKDTLLSESVDLDARLQSLVRAGLMPANTIPVLRKAIAKVQGGMVLQGPERDVMANFLNSMMFIVLGDDAIFNKARVNAKAVPHHPYVNYATEETEVVEEEAEQVDEVLDTPKAVKSYKTKAEKSFKDAMWKHDKKSVQTVQKRLYGLSHKKVDEEALDEVSDKTKASYASKASSFINNNAHSMDPATVRKWNRRQKGMSKLRKEEARADIAAITQMNESYRTTFNAALEQFNIKSPSELDEEKRKEFFNFVDQNYKKGDN